VDGRLYVIGEEDDEVGPVKIGIVYQGKRAGLNTGNWRRLIELESVPVDVETLRWREWLTHRRLRHRHVHGEWFNVRDLVPLTGWSAFLDGVRDASLHGIRPFRIGAGDCEARTVRQVRTCGRRHFVVECTCGDFLDGYSGKAMPTVLRRYATEHLELPKGHLLLQELRYEVHNEGFRDVE